jgi:hypothetical protein
MAPRSKRDKEVADYLHKQLPLIQTLKELEPKHVRALIPYITDSHDALCLCVHNTLKNYDELDKDGINYMKTLNPSEEDIQKYRYLSAKRFTKSGKVFTDRAGVLEQTGEGLPLILSAILPVLTSLLSK